MRKITLCGSCRFTAEFKTCIRLLGKLGVHASGLSTYRDDFPDDTDLAPVDKEILDLLHLGKVRDADIVLIIDVHFEPPFDTEMRRLDAPMADPKPYVGFSTAREIFQAYMAERPIAFLSDLLDAGTSIESAMTELANINPYELKAIEIEPAKQLLELAIGQQTVKDQAIDTERNILIAILSHISRQTRPENSLSCPDMADQTLAYLKISPKSYAETAPLMNLIADEIGSEADRGG